MSANRCLPLIIVDAANVVGCTPDGWWTDRVGANLRLRDALQSFRFTGSSQLPGPMEVIMVVEGQARNIDAIEGVCIESAAKDIGDNKIVEVVSKHIDRKPTVITSDRGLIRRVGELGASTMGARSVPRGSKNLLLESQHHGQKARKRLKKNQKNKRIPILQNAQMVQNVEELSQQREKEGSISTLDSSSTFRPDPVAVEIYNLEQSVREICMNYWMNITDKTLADHMVTRIKDDTRRRGQLFC